MLNLLRAFSLIGLVVSGYLLFLKLTGSINSIVGCGDGSGCANVLGSRWSEFFGIPVSAFSALIYASLIWATMGPLKRTLASLLAFLLAFAAIWFTGLQMFVVDAFCPWCLFTHLIGAVTAGLIFYLIQKQNDRRAQFRSERTMPVFAAVALSAILMLGQCFGPGPDTHLLTDVALQGQTDGSSSGKSSSKAVASDQATNQSKSVEPKGSDSNASKSTQGGDTEETESAPLKSTENSVPIHIRGEGPTAKFLDKEYCVSSLPHIGKADAPYVLVKYFDYTCGACKNLDGDLGELMKKYPDKFAVVLLATPLNRACNPHFPEGLKDHQYACELARLSLAAWKSKPEAFAEVHEILFARPVKPPHQARKEIEKLLAPVELQFEPHKAWIDELIAADLEDYDLLCFQSLEMPKLRVKDGKVISGVVKNSAEFIKLIEGQLKIEK